MRLLLVVLSAVAAAALAAPIATAERPVVVSGGGTGTLAADLDPSIDPDIDGSHFGLGVVFAGGTARGHVECLMAWAGGPGVGRLELTVIGAFAGAPGDTDLTNGNYDLPVERVATGQIAIR